MAEAGRPDYNASLKFRQVAPGEPIFLILGRDPGSGPAVRHWATLAYDAGVHVALVESAMQQADRLDAWPDNKAPDVDHMTASEALQLAHQFDRRAWQARPQAHAPVIMLAERRGYAQAKARDNRTERLLEALQAAALKCLQLYPAGEASSTLAIAAAEAGAHLAAAGELKEAAGG